MPPNVRYYSQTAPFWDFVADLEGQGSSHPAFAWGRNNNENNDGNPWVNSFNDWPFAGLPHRGRRYGPPRSRPGPPPPPNAAAPPPPPPPAPPAEGEVRPSEPRGPPPSYADPPHQSPEPHHRRRGRCGRQNGFPMPGAQPFLNNLAEMFQSQLFGDDGTTTKKEKKSEDFTPDIDVFDTETSYHVHISLPGAKKEDVGVNWDAEKSELSVAGIIYRPGDEEMLKTLALDERKVGAFERKVRLGSRANPAQIDVDGITAKMEDGVLRVEVPKLDSGYVEIRKVDIE